MKRSMLSLCVLLSSLGGMAMAADEETTPAEAPAEEAVTAVEAADSPADNEEAPAQPEASEEEAAK